MKPHIAQTIEDIELKIGFLQRLAEALRTFDDVARVGAPTPASPETNGNGFKNSPAGRQRSPMEMKACRPTARAKDAMRLVAVVEKIQEPITVAAIVEKAGVEAKKASNFITVSQRKGWLSRVGVGKYKRLSGFGGAVLVGGGWREVISGYSSRN